MTNDLETLSARIEPFLKSLGDLFLRNVAASKRDNIGGNPNDAQTETDLAVEAHVMEFLRSISDFPILSEESAKLNDSRDVFANAPAYWVCDPIDGTVFFQRLEYGEFGTLLSLVEGGNIVGAWGYFPFADKRDDVLVTSITPDAVYINGVRSHANSKTNGALLGRCGVSRRAKQVTDTDRARIEVNKTACGITPKRPSLHSVMRFARGELDYFVNVGSHPWDFTVMAKIVTALGGVCYKFSTEQSATLYEGDVILDAAMVVACVAHDVDYNAVISPLFVGTAYEKTCVRE